MKFRRLVIAGAVMLALSPSLAHGQSSSMKDNLMGLARKVGVHANGSYRHPLDSDVTKGWGRGLSVGLSPGHTNGWRYPFSVTFFSQDLHSSNGLEFGSIRTRAIIGGIGYGWHFGRLSTGASMQTGYAFNDASLDDDVEHAFNVPNGTVSMDVGNSWLLRPSIKAEYFVTSKFTVRVSGDYVYIRPGIVVTTPEQRFERRWDESNLHANFGVAFYPFRKR